MKIALFAATAALMLGSVAPAMAQTPPEVEIQNAVARVVVMVEDRADIAVAVEMGAADLPRPTVRVLGSKTIVDGGLATRNGPFGGRRASVQNCRSGPTTATQPEGASVQYQGRQIELSDAPLIIIRTPRAVNVEASVGVFGAIGRGATSVDLTNGGCGDWTVANVEGPVDLTMGGSGRARLGTSRALDATLGGAGDLTAGRTGPLDLTLGGAGQAQIAEVDGPVDITIGGSGEVKIRQGRASTLDVTIGGSGDVDFGGTAGDVDVTIAGSGDVRVGAMTGRLDRTIVGSGDITVGN